MRCRYATLALTLILLSSALSAQTPRTDTGIEDIVILRSLRLSRISPTEYCAQSRTGFPGATAEDRYDFKPVATDARSEVLGAESDPPGYTQPSIATVRLWKKRT